MKKKARQNRHRKISVGSKISYQAIFTPEPEGGYTVTVPALAGCITYGATFEEALKNAREVILLCLEVMRDQGEEFPAESGSLLVSTVELSPAELHA